jgi:universal stress protein A
MNRARGRSTILPLERILCPTDYSEPSFEALDAAAELAGQFGAELILLHVVAPVPVLPAPYATAAATSFDVAEYQRAMERNAGETLARIASERIGEAVRTRTLTVQGEAADEIARLAEAEGVDLIVIATHGRTGWRRVVFGSVAEKVVRLAACPVLCIRARAALAPHPGRD